MVLSHEVQTGSVPSYDRAVNDTYVRGKELHGRTALSGGKRRELEEISVRWHTVAYANKYRAEGRVETILPEYGVFCKRPTRAGQYCHP